MSVSVTPAWTLAGNDAFQTTAVSIPRPSSGVTVGDFMVMDFLFANAQTGVPTITGWTLIDTSSVDSSKTCYTWYRIATSGDTSGGSWSMTCDDGFVDLWSIAAWTGVDNTTPFDVGPVLGGAGSTTPAWTTITSPGTGSVWVGLVNIRQGGGAVTDPTPPPTNQIVGTTPYGDGNSRIYSAVVNSGAFAPTATTATTSNWVTVAFFLKAASGSSVTITDIDGDESITSTQTGIVATGTGYDGTTTLAIFQGSTSKSQTVTGNTSTTLTFNAVRNAGVGTLSLYYGAATARATTGANTGDLAITLTPPDARSYVTLTSVDTTSANRLTATPDLAIGDQVEVTSVTGGAISDVTLTADGRWNALTTVISFTFQVWAVSDSTIGAVGTITAIQTTGFQKTPSWMLKRHSRGRVQSFDLFRKSIQPGISDTTSRDVWLNWYGLSAQSAAAVNGTAIASGIGNASLLAAAIIQATAQASGIGTGTLQPSLVLSALAQAVSLGHGIFIGATGAVVSGSAIAAAIGYGSINSTRQLDAAAIANAVGNGSATPAQIINAALIAAAEAFGLTAGATGATVSGAAIAAALGMSSTAASSLLAANAQATGLGTGTIISSRVLNAIVTAIAESTGFVDATSGATVSGAAIAMAISSGAFAATRIINAPAVAMSAGQASLIAQQIISAQAQAQVIGAMAAPAAVVVGANAVATAESIASAIGQLYDVSVTPPATRIIAIDAGGRRDITIYYRERNVTLQ